MASAAGAAGVTITVTHELDAARPARDRRGAVHADRRRSRPGLRMYHVVVRDPKGRVLPSQITNYQHDHRGAQYDDLVFSYDFAAGQKSAPRSRSKPWPPPRRPMTPCVYARFVPERFDDMAWENDRIAHRMYGLALNSDRPPAANACAAAASTCGRKRVTYPIVDRWYAKGHDQFHKDGEGEGLDLYSIGGSRGAGGTGVWDGTKLWTSDNFVDRAGARRTGRGARRSSSTTRRSMRARRPGRRDQAIHRRLRRAISMRSKACSISRADDAHRRHRHHASTAGGRVSRRPCSRAIPMAAG